MKLINRYVKEVGKRLPLIKGREDIEKELRSTLEDMLEDRAQKAGRPADETMELELLKEYGSPSKVAATYNPHPYLIGPQMFPFFIMILKIVLICATFGLFIATFIQIVTQMPMTETELVSMIGKGIGNIIATVIVAFGNIVLAFAILERFVPDFEAKLPNLEPKLPDLDLKLSEFGLHLDSEKEWDPASLMRDPDPDSVKRGELIGEIVFSFVALALLNLYPQWLGLFFFTDGELLHYIPLFSDVFFKFIPWINIILLAQIALDVYLLRETMWNIISHFAKILIVAANLALTFVIFRTPGIFGFTLEYFEKIPTTADSAQTLTLILSWVISFGLIVVLIIQGIELAKAIYRLLRINYRTK